MGLYLHDTMFSTLKNTVFINEPQCYSESLKEKKKKKARAVQFQNSRGKKSNIFSPLLHDNPRPPPVISSSEFYLNILKVE